MKNAIKYYYNLIVDSICQKNNLFYLNINNQLYVLIPVNDNLNNAIILSKNATISHEIITNLKGEFVTNINNFNYVLLKVRCLNRIINFYDVYSFSQNNKINNNYNLELSWDKLWKNKIDNLEYQISQNGKKYPLIMESFSYFNGLTENAIQLFGTINKQFVIYCISHKRVGDGDSLIDFYNPLNYLIDCNIRDVAEYFKNCFINKHCDITEILSFIKGLNNVEIICFFNRMLYPSFYYDSIEDIMINNLDEKNLKKIIEIVNEYEELLRKLYIYIYGIGSIDLIEWIKKT